MPKLHCVDTEWIEAHKLLNSRGELKNTLIYVKE